MVALDLEGRMGLLPFISHLSLLGHLVLAQSLGVVLQEKFAEQEEHFPKVVLRSVEVMELLDGVLEVANLLSHHLHFLSYSAHLLLVLNHKSIDCNLLLNLKLVPHLLQFSLGELQPVQLEAEHFWR